MKKSIIAFLTFITSLSTIPCHISAIPTLHVIGIADTDEYRCYDLFETDRRFVDSLLMTIASRSEMLLQKYWFIGKHANPDQLKSFLDDPSFAVDANDTILFYYTGHGCRTENTKTDLPLLAFGGRYTQDLLSGNTLTCMERRIR